MSTLEHSVKCLAACWVAGVGSFQGTQRRLPAGRTRFKSFLLHFCSLSNLSRSSWITGQRHARVRYQAANSLELENRQFPKSATEGLRCAGGSTISP
jgi:hypothetical protein